MCQFSERIRLQGEEEEEEAADLDPPLEAPEAVTTGRVRKKKKRVKIFPILEIWLTFCVPDAKELLQISCLIELAALIFGILIRRVSLR